MKMKSEKVVYSRIGLVWRYVRKYKGTVVGAEICLLFIFMQTAILPMIISIMVDEVFYNRNVTIFASLIGLYSLIFIGARLSNALYQPLWQYLTNNYVYDISKTIFSKNLRAKADYLYNIKTGDIMTRVNHEAFEFIFILIRNGLRSLNRALVFLFAFVMLFFIHWSLALYSIVVVPLLIFATKKSSQKLSALSSDNTVKYALFGNWLFEMVNGLREIRLLTMQKYTQKRLAFQQKEMIILSNKISRVNFISNIAQNFTILFCQLIFFVLCSFLMINNKITIGFFLAANEYYSMMYDTLKYIVSLYLDWKRRRVYVDRLYEALQIENEVNEQPPINVMNGEILFHNVGFSYIQGNPILDGLNIRIKSGERIAVVGESGVGKSTLVYLLLRFHDPNIGEILIDGQRLSDHSYSSIRKNVGVIQQDIVFFNGTIRDNIDVGDQKHSDSELDEACERAHILHYINSLPDRYDTIIGTEGDNMSGGQRQRLMIARIFLMNPKIVILDEATSALDSYSENFVRNELDELAKGRTTIVIAHRYSAIKGTDKIAFIEKGRVIDIGTNDELITRCPSYSKLFYEQMKLVKEMAV